MERPKNTPQHGTPAAVICTLLALLALTGCTVQKPPVAAPEAVGQLVDCHQDYCVITEDTWSNHIEPRHCDGTCPPKSLFVPAHCGSRADAVAFCRTLMNRPSCVGVDQGGGRIAFSANLAATVGSNRGNACNDTTRGTVIYDEHRDEVVTQFPGNP
jgi:hypothetical protein